MTETETGTKTATGRRPAGQSGLSDLLSPWVIRRRESPLPDSAFCLLCMDGMVVGAQDLLSAVLILTRDLVEKLRLCLMLMKVTGIKKEAKQSRTAQNADGGKQV